MKKINLNAPLTLKHALIFYGVSVAIGLLGTASVFGLPFIGFLGNKEESKIGGNNE